MCICNQEDKDFLKARDWGYAVVLYILLQVREFWGRSILADALPIQ